MVEIGRDPRAVRLYERIRDEVAEHRVVDEADAVITRVWICELERIHGVALGLVASESAAERPAREELRAAQDAGRPMEIARAHARLAALQADRGSRLAGARWLIVHTATELERVGLAGAERGRRVEHDLERLHAAWTGAYGVGSVESVRGRDD